MATKKVETKAAEAVKDTSIVEVKKEVPAVKKNTDKAVPAVKKETVKKAEVKAEVKPETKAVIKPELKAEIKTEVKAEAKPEVKPAAKAAKPAAKVVKPAAKAVTKTPAKTKELKATIVVEYGGKQITAKDILDQAKKAFTKANKGVEIKTIEVYVKPEENAAYYVVNGIGSEEYKINL